MEVITSTVRRQDLFDVSGAWDVIVDCKLTGHETREQLLAMIRDFDDSALHRLSEAILSSMFEGIVRKRVHHLTGGTDCYRDTNVEALQYGVPDTVTLHTVAYPMCHFNNEGTLQLD